MIYSNNEKTSDSIESILKSMGLMRTSIVGDGNCFFRAISKNVTEDTEEGHGYYRKRLVENLENNPYTDIDEETKKENKDLINNYRSGQWERNPKWQSNDFQIKRMAEALQRTIYIFIQETEKK